MTKNSPQIASKGRVAEVFWTFLKLGITAFGGPIAHLGYFRKALVEEKGWVSESQFSQLLAICQFLPGPASSQLGFALGLLRAGWLGAVAAFLAFTLPSVALLLGFAAALPWLSGDFGTAAVHGLKLVACAIVADAVLGMFKKLCPDVQRQSIALSAAAVLLLAKFAWLQILVVAAGGGAGLLLCRPVALADRVSIPVGYGRRHAAILCIVFVALLLALPLLATSGGLSAVAEAFYRAGALVFGGGHVVLPLLKDAVVAAGWVDQENFLAGYGAAQAIPGPLFAFSAYLGALVQTGHAPWLGAAVALLFMFLPGFLLVAAALPWWQAIAHKPAAASAISGVNAAVVGLLIAALYDPIMTSAIVSNADFAVALIGFGLLAVWRLSPLFTVVWCVAASLLSG